MNIPQRNNNPGNLKSSPLITKSFGTLPVDKYGHVIFHTPEDGMRALKEELGAKVSGRTRTGISGTSTLSDLGHIYAEDPKWTSGVAKILGVSPQITLSELVTSKGLDALAMSIARQEGFYAKG